MADRAGWSAPASPPPPRRVWRDWALIGVLAPTAVLEALLRPDLPWPLLSAIVAIALLPTLLWRRTRPLTMLVIAFASVAVVGLVIGQDLQLYTIAYLLLLPYALFRWGSPRAAVAGLVVFAASIVFSLLRGGGPPADVIGGVAVAAATLAIGLAFRFRAAGRMREREQVAALERENLARDLHDTVAHHVSAIAIQAQAGIATASTRPESAAEALGAIETEASRALREMRSMVRSLRGHEADLRPLPRIADLSALADDAGSPSTVVRLTGDIDAVPATTASAVFRIVQESVTNARRHARSATRIEVAVDVGPSAVTCASATTANPSRAPSPASASPA